MNNFHWKTLDDWKQYKRIQLSLRVIMFLNVLFLYSNTIKEKKNVNNFIPPCIFLRFNLLISILFKCFQTNNVKLITRSCYPSKYTYNQSEIFFFDKTNNKLSDYLENNFFIVPRQHRIRMHVYVSCCPWK